MCAPVMVELEGETDPLAIAMKELKWVLMLCHVLYEVWCTTFCFACPPDFKLKFVCDGHRLYGDDQFTEAVEKSVYLEVEIMYHSLTVESTNYWDTSTCHRKLQQKQKTKT